MRRARGTSEMGMHLTIYQMRPDVHSVVHAHPPTATGFAVAGRALQSGAAPRGSSSWIGAARDSVCPARRADRRHAPYIPKYDALPHLANHVWSATAMRFPGLLPDGNGGALARITLVAELLGRAQVLPGPRCGNFSTPHAYNARSRNHFEPGSPMAAEEHARAEREN